MSNPNWKSFSSQGSTSAEIKSHSSVLFNERLNGLFAMYDMESMDMDIKPSINNILKTTSMLKSIWRNIRPIVLNQSSVRNQMGLNTVHPGLYTPDIGFARIQELVNYLIRTGEYSYDNLVYVIQEIHSIENIVREILQFFSYFIRTASPQKPDISVASEKYKDMADQRTVEEFNQLLGENKRGIFKQNLEVPVEPEFFDGMVEDLENAEEYEEFNEEENE